MVRGRGAVVSGVGHLGVVLAVVLVVSVVVTMEPVRHVAGRARRRVLAEEVAQESPEAVHRKGL
jgi:hypothetical protein